MILYEQFTLDNGLTVIVHEDKSSPLVAMNILYRVGSKDEVADKTGFAHLFEHLMFGGSENVPDFDEPIQMAGGENNAFTNSDITNYYNVVPTENIETLFWLESDRMNQLDFSEHSLNVQKKVVIEEFKETCLNRPYGDVWHNLSGLAYKKHSYQWPTIGKVPAHIEEASLEDVESFFYNYYRPNNAILVVTGNIEVAQIKTLANKYFGPIPSGTTTRPPTLFEDTQVEERILNLSAKVPSPAFYMGFHMPGRNDADYYACDLLSDIFGNGRSSRFYVRLYKEKQMFSTIDAYISGSIDPGLFIIEGKPMPGFTIDQSIEAIWEELEEVKENGITEKELLKLKNKMESSLSYSEVSILTKAMNLAYFAHLGDVSLVNQQAASYNAITCEDIQRVANDILQKRNCSTVSYFPAEVI